MICGREIKARISSLRALICGFKSGEGISLSKNKNKLEVRFTKVKQSLTRILFFYMYLVRFHQSYGVLKGFTEFRVKPRVSSHQLSRTSYLW